MERFHIIDEAEAIIRTGGVYKQVKLFQRDGGIYAGIAGGYVRLYHGGGTGLPKVMWDDIEIPGVTGYAKDGTGRLSLPHPIKTIEQQP